MNRLQYDRSASLPGDPARRSWERGRLLCAVVLGAVVVIGTLSARAQRSESDIIVYGLVKNQDDLTAYSWKLRTEVKVGGQAQKVDLEEVRYPAVSTMRTTYDEKSIKVIAETYDYTRQSG